MTRFEELEREYLWQQTPEGKAALSVKRDLLQKFRDVTGTTQLNLGVVQPLYDAHTHQIINYIKVL